MTQLTQMTHLTKMDNLTKLKFDANIECCANDAFETNYSLLLAIPILACLFDNTCQLFSKENNIEALMGKKVKLIVAYFKGV
jgi:hypothetical protein